MSRRERQRRRRRHGGHPAARGLVVALLVVVAAAGLAVAGAVGWVISVAESAPSIDRLKPLDEGSNSIVYAADGSRLGFIPSLILRSPLPRDEIPRVVKQATVAIEDRRFYEHKGVDYPGVVRAALKNIASHRTLQGGSTLTMQLVRNIYIPDEKSRRDLKRKIKEAKLAEELEKEHPGRRGKDWILTKYLNSVPYGTVGGQTAIGIQAAARMFLDKPATRLTLADAALLAGLPQAPSEYNPFLDSQAALDRRTEVLQAMVKARMITPAQAARAERAPLGVKQNRYYTRRREQYFFDYVKDQLFQRYGARTVRQGGLRVYTTIDLKRQRQARAAIAGRLNEPGDPASAIVSVDPRNGRILAMASSQDYGKTSFNYATQAHRQPGSTFKVMILMAALARGVDPNRTTYVSHQLGPGWLPGYPDYGVETYSHSYGGSMNIVKATLQSDNTVYAQLDADVGPEAVREAAYKLGIKTHLDAYPAEGLGGLKYGVSPLEMANAYATIADGGWRNRPVAVLKVVHRDGQVDNLGKGKRVKVFPDGVTAEATKILHQNIESGTGTAANFGCPAAGKTGTTSDYKDAWFVGFTPRMSTAVWVGYPNPPIPMLSVHGIEVAGATFPAEIWHDFMNVAHGSFCGDFPPPSTPFVASSFYGRYARQGGKSDRGYPSNGYNRYTQPGTYTPSAPAPRAPAPSTGGGGASPTGANGARPAGGNGRNGRGTGKAQRGTGGVGDYNNPTLYESPPQSAPRGGRGGGRSAGGGRQGGQNSRGGGRTGGSGGGGGNP